MGSQSKHIRRLNCPLFVRCFAKHSFEFDLVFGVFHAKTVHESEVNPQLKSGCGNSTPNSTGYLVGPFVAGTGTPESFAAITPSLSTVCTVRSMTALIISACAR